MDPINWRNGFTLLIILIRSLANLSTPSLISPSRTDALHLPVCPNGWNSEWDYLDERHVHTQHSHQVNGSRPGRLASAALHADARPSQTRVNQEIRRTWISWRMATKAENWVKGVESDESNPEARMQSGATGWIPSVCDESTATLQTRRIERIKSF